VTRPLTFTRNPRVIQLQAMAFDTIQHIGPKLKCHTSPFLLPNMEVPDAIGQIDNLMTDIREWYLRARQLTRKYSANAQESQDAVDQAFWEFCLSESMGIQEEVPMLYPPESQSARKLYEFMILTEIEELFKCTSVSVLGDNVSAKDAGEMYKCLLRKINKMILGKVFCITSTGLMALVPPLAKEGDRLSHVRGGKMPIVLRRKAPRERVAELIGVCYVHGVEDVRSSSNWEDWMLE
jgi:hypothetical protein